MLERAENQLANEWFTAESAAGESKLPSFRYEPGGVHLFKTMILDELSADMQASEPGQSGAVARAILDDNILGKPTGSARKLALSRLNTLFGVMDPQHPPVAQHHLDRSGCDFGNRR